MNEPIDPTTLSDPRDLAAYWFTRTRSGAMTDQEHQAFAAWRHADPINDRQYRYVEALWDAAGKVPRQEWRGLGYAAPTHFAGRRRMVYGIGVACSVVLAGVVALQYPGARTLEYEVTLTTRRGHRRRETLPDGSVLDLNTDTRALVRFYGDQRTVALTAGEILCRVAPDPRRPFVVNVDKACVRAIGTWFNVRRRAEGFDVAVGEGEVEVSAGPWWNRRAIRLVAGREAVVEHDNPLLMRTNLDFDASTAWRNGQIVFNDTPLSEAVSQLNGYLADPVAVSDPRVRSLRISGIFRIDDPNALLMALPRIVPVRVVTRSDGQIMIVAR